MGMDWKLFGERETFTSLDELDLSFLDLWIDGELVQIYETFDIFPRLVL